MLILKSRELLLRESSETLMPSLKWFWSCPPVLQLECMEMVSAGPWFLWSKGQLHPSCTSPYPQHTRRVSQGGTAHPTRCLLLLPTETSSRSQEQQWWKKPEVTKMSCFRYLIFASGRSRTNHMFFSPYVMLTMLFSSYVFISTAGYSTKNTS